MKKYLFLFILLSIEILWSQTELAREEQLAASLRQQVAAEKTLDSLQTAFDELAGEIENEKKEKKLTEKQLAEWFEQLKNMSRALEKQKEKTRDITQNSAMIRRQLEKLYSQKIDSLRNASAKVKSKVQKEEIEKKRAEYTEKRIAILPAFNTFSFNPARVLEIDPRQAKDSLEYLVYTSYLRSAGKEINEVLDSVKKSRIELQDMAYLQERSRRFLDEIDNSPVFSFSTTSPSRATYQTGVTVDNSEFPRMAAVNSQVQSLFDILDQFGQNKSDKYPYPFVSPLDSQKVISSLDDYIDLLRDTEKLLEAYLTVVNNKLSTH